MHHLVITGFLAALCAGHAIAAACALYFFRPLGRTDARSAGSRADRESLPAFSTSMVSPDRGLLMFGLLNAGVATLDGGLARAYALLPTPEGLAPALLTVEAARVVSTVLLVGFTVEYAELRSRRWTVVGLCAVGGLFALAGVFGLLRRVDGARASSAWIAGLELYTIRAPATTLGLVFAALSAVGVLYSLAILARAFLGGRREAAGFIGLTLLVVATLHEALRDAGWVVGPPLEPVGYAAFINGVALTLLTRFVALRSKLVARARELRARSRALARSYEDLRAAQDELVRKEQLAAVGELSAVVAHEVRNPLAIIMNAVATLRREGIADEDRATLLGILDEETSRLNRIVGDLLRYARPLNIERQVVSLRELVERGLGLAGGRADLAVELVESQPVEKILGDPNLLRQVIDNLVDNAVQAMSGGGVLTVTLANTELEGARGVEVMIQDTGEGMDTQVRARALDPFFTTRPSGTGLGLAIVARIIDAHGGALRIRSKAGAGTVMHVFLPLTGEPQKPSARNSDRGSLP